MQKKFKLSPPETVHAPGPLMCKKFPNQRNLLNFKSQGDVLRGGAISTVVILDFSTHGVVGAIREYSTCACE